MSNNEGLRERVAGVERELRDLANSKGDHAAALKGLRKTRTFWLTVGEGLSYQKAADMLRAALKGDDD